MSRTTLSYCAWLPAVLVLAATAAPSALAQKDRISESKDAVKVTATADKADDKGNQTVTVTIDIVKPWHLYANPVGNEDLVSSQTLLTVKAKSKLDDVKTDYPAGKLKVDKDVGNYKIYEDKIVIKATVRRAKDDTSPLEVSLHLQACDESKCLMPSDMKIPVEMK